MNSADRAHRVLSVTIEIPSYDHWYVYCAADLAESDHIRDCETIVGSIRFEWKAGPSIPPAPSLPTRQ